MASTTDKILTAALTALCKRIYPGWTSTDTTLMLNMLENNIVQLRKEVSSYVKSPKSK